MLTTLDTVRLKAGDTVCVEIGQKMYEAQVIDVSDPSKLYIILKNGAGLWVGRRAVELVEDGK